MQLTPSAPFLTVGAAAAVSTGPVPQAQAQQPAACLQHHIAFITTSNVQSASLHHICCCAGGGSWGSRHLTQANCSCAGCNSMLPSLRTPCTHPGVSSTPCGCLTCKSSPLCTAASGNLVSSLTQLPASEVKLPECQKSSILTTAGGFPTNWGSLSAQEQASHPINLPMMQVRFWRRCSAAFAVQPGAAHSAGWSS